MYIQMLEVMYKTICVYKRFTIVCGVLPLKFVFKGSWIVAVKPNSFSFVMH